MVEPINILRFKDKYIIVFVNHLFAVSNHAKTNWPPLNWSIQFSSICMRSSQPCPFLPYYRSYTIILFDRCISFEHIQGQLNIFPFSCNTQQFHALTKYTHYLHYGRHLNTINVIEVTDIYMRKNYLVSRHSTQ